MRVLVSTMMAVAGFAASTNLAQAASPGQTALMASIPPSKSMTFKAFTGSTELGTHRIQWRESGGDVVATIEIDFDAKVLFVPVYKYKHRSQETWRDGRLVAIATKTDDDGDKEFVNASLNGEVYDVKSTAFNGETPAPVAPTSYWAYNNLKVGTWLNTQTGKILKVKVAPAGVETVKTGKGAVSARRYNVSGDVPLSLWYDAANRWVKSEFTVNGTKIEYVLQ